MEEKNELLFNELNEENLESMIYEIRGERVMLDFDLARIYGYETRRFNEQVKRNKSKFPNDFMFQLTSIESDNLAMSQKATAQIWTIGNKGGRTTFPQLMKMSQFAKTFSNTKHYHNL